MTIPIASINASTPPAVADAISTVSVLAGETMHVYLYVNILGFHCYTVPGVSVVTIILEVVDG